jgi:hypothetical protein
VSADGAAVEVVAVRVVFRVVGVGVHDMLGPPRGFFLSSARGTQQPASGSPRLFSERSPGSAPAAPLRSLQGSCGRRGPVGPLYGDVAGVPRRVRAGPPEWPRCRLGECAHRAEYASTTGSVPERLSPGRSGGAQASGARRG